MVSAEVQRTLVKSPPELWSELSDPAALARHLGEIGEIRISRVDPEKTLEWEAEKASGTVAIRPSGWGTRVTLTLRRHEDTDGDAQQGTAEESGELGPAAEAAGAPPVEAQAPRTLDEQPPDAAVEERPEGAPPLARAAAEEPDEREDAGDVETPVGPPPRLSWWRRLFSRRAQPHEHETAAAGLDASHDAEPSPGELDERARAAQLPEPATAAAQAAQHHEGGGEQQAAPQGAADKHPVAADPHAEAAQPDPSELVAVEQATALLSAVLDRLGAAHHRPFSRP